MVISFISGKLISYLSKNYNYFINFPKPNQNPKTFTLPDLNNPKNDKSTQFDLQTELFNQ